MPITRASKAAASKVPQVKLPVSKKLASGTKATKGSPSTTAATTTKETSAKILRRDKKKLSYSSDESSVSNTDAEELVSNDGTEESGHDSDDSDSVEQQNESCESDDDGSDDSKDDDDKEGPPAQKKLKTSDTKKASAQSSEASQTVTSATAKSVADDVNQVFVDALTLATKQCLFIAIGSPGKDAKVAGTTMVFLPDRSKLCLIKTSLGSILGKEVYYGAFDQNGTLFSYKAIELPDELILPQLTNEYLFPSQKKEEWLSYICFTAKVENVLLTTIPGKMDQVKELSVIGLDTYGAMFRVAVVLWGGLVQKEVAQGDIWVFLNARQYIYKNVPRFTAGDSAAIFNVTNLTAGKKFAKRLRKVAEKSGLGAELKLPDGFVEKKLT